MIALIVLSSIAAYVVIGALYARSQAVAAYRRAKAEWHLGSIVRESVHWQLAFRTLLWPWYVPLDLFRDVVHNWMTAPIADRQDRAEQLRADAEQWRIQQYTGTQQERAMAAELAAMCEERAREIDL